MRKSTSIIRNVKVIDTNANRKKELFISPTNMHSCQDYGKNMTFVLSHNVFIMGSPINHVARF